MSDEEKQAEEKEPQDVWDFLKMEDPDEDEKGEYEAEAEEQEEAIEKLDKTMKKYTSKMDERIKEMDRKLLREMSQRFQASEDPMTVDLFKAVAADIRTPEDFDKAADLARQQAARLKEAYSKQLEKYEEEAKKQAARAWGTGPVGTPAPRSDNYEEDRMKKIAAGDIVALTDALLEGNMPGQNR